MLSPLHSEAKLLYEEALRLLNAEEFDKGIDLLETAVAAGYAPAQAHLGKCYQHGIGCTKDFAKAFSLFSLAANQGNGEGEYGVGFCMLNGHGTAKNCKEAVRMYKLAMEKGIPLAFNDMGYCYNYGLGVENNYDKGLEHYHRAGQLGCGLAMYNIGNCYEYGKGVTQNPKEAVKWYLLAAKGGVTSAHSKLGHFYLEGLQTHGLEKNYEKAIELLRMAAKAGEKTAADTLKRSDVAKHAWSLDWPKSINEVPSSCQIAISEILCCTNSNFSCSWLPSEISVIIVRLLIIHWPEIHIQFK